MYVTFVSNTKQMASSSNLGLLASVNNSSPANKWKDWLYNYKRIFFRGLRKQLAMIRIKTNKIWKFKMSILVPTKKFVLVDNHCEGCCWFIETVCGSVRLASLWWRKRKGWEITHAPDWLPLVYEQLWVIPLRSRWKKRDLRHFDTFTWRFWG